MEAGELVDHDHDQHIEGRAGELVDQGQRPPAGHSRRHGTDQQFSQPVSSLTRASDARDARRSHRSVEGDEKPHKMRERERQTATKPRYYIRGIEITAQTGLGRTGGGGGLALDFGHQNHAVHMGLGRASWHGTQGLPPPF